MNRAEYIIAVVGFANEEGVISQNESVRVLSQVASMLNSGQPAADIDESPEMVRLWKEVGKRWGKRTPKPTHNETHE